MQLKFRVLDINGDPIRPLVCFDESGKVVEEWASYDLLGAMRQLGAIPEPQGEHSDS